MRYRVHEFSLKMTKDQDKLELFLNSLDGEVVAIIPNVSPHIETPCGESGLDDKVRHDPSKKYTVY